MRKFNLPCSLLFSLLLLADGCTLINFTVTKTVPISKQVNYDDAFEKAVKACRNIGIFLKDANKDAGQVNCFTDYPRRANYELNVHLDKDGHLLKNIDIRAFGFPGQILPPSESGAKVLLEEYTKALRQLEIE